MIAKLFALANKRLALRDDIKIARDRIAGGKIATALDLTQCFFDAADNPRGSIGRLIERNRDLFESFLSERTDNGMPAFPVPIVQLNRQSRALYERYRLSAAHSENFAYFEKQASEMMPLLEREGTIFIHQEHADLAAVYVDDYLETLNRILLTETRMPLSALSGNGEKTLDILNDLRTVPDYSHLFTSEPPAMERKPHRNPEQEKFQPGSPAFA